MAKLKLKFVNAASLLAIVCLTAVTSISIRCVPQHKALPVAYGNIAPQEVMQVAIELVEKASTILYGRFQDFMSTSIGGRYDDHLNELKMIIDTAEYNILRVLEAHQRAMLAANKNTLRELPYGGALSDTITIMTHLHKTLKTLHNALSVSRPVKSIGARAIGIKLLANQKPIYEGLNKTAATARILQDRLKGLNEPQLAERVQKLNGELGGLLKALQSGGNGGADAVLASLGHRLACQDGISADMLSKYAQERQDILLLSKRLAQ